jgi:hypothetical protein
MRRRRSWIATVRCSRPISASEECGPSAVVLCRCHPILRWPRMRPQPSPAESGWATTARSSRSPEGSKPGPPGSEAAPIIDVGRSLVMPGLIDLHNHLAYNTLPLWIEPGQQTPFAHHNSWTRAETYAPSTTWL